MSSMSLLSVLLTGCGARQDYALHTQSDDPGVSEHLRFVKRYTDTMMDLFAGEDSPYCYEWIEDEDERRAYVRSWWCRMVDPGNPIDRKKAQECLNGLERRLDQGYGAELESVDYGCAMCKLEQLPKGQQDACHDNDPYPDPDEEDTGDTGDTGSYGGSPDLLLRLLSRR